MKKNKLSAEEKFLIGMTEEYQRYFIRNLSKNIKKALQDRKQLFAINK